LKRHQKELYQRPLHPYTKELLSTVLIGHKDNNAINGRAFSEAFKVQNPQGGCIYYSKCGIAEERFRNNKPQIRKVLSGHWVTCFLAKAFD